jgi:hypothetical protein
MNFYLVSVLWFVFDRYQYVICIGSKGWILSTKSLFGWLVADGWSWFVLREKYCWLFAGGWFVLREKYGAKRKFA